MPSRLEPSRVPHLLVFRNAGPEPIQHLTADEREELTQKWNRWYEELATAGKVQQGQPLAANGRVVSGSRGERVIDGPYAEAKEAIGGYFLLAPMDLDEATAIAKMCPSLPYGLTVEVRPVAAVSPTLEGVRGRPV
ncbi:MAG: YciI family protein [Opitutus sp.]